MISMLNRILTRKSIQIQNKNKISKLISFNPSIASNSTNSLFVFSHFSSSSNFKLSKSGKEQVYFSIQNRGKVDLKQESKWNDNERGSEMKEEIKEEIKKEKEKEGKKAFIFWILPLIAFLLGTWQVYRMKRKEQLIETVSNRLQLEGDSIPQSDVSIINQEENEFKRFDCKGRFLNDFELIMGPKTLKGHNGYWVVTPFLLNDGRIIMVNRGWTPFSRKESSTRSQDLIEGTTSISGILKLTKPKPRFVPENEPSKQQWCWTDVTAMADHLSKESGKKVLPILLHLIGVDRTITYPTPFPAVPNLPNNHLSYVITWYGLSAALSAMTLVLTKKIPKINKWN